MANDLRVCKVCGNTYKYCPTCAKYAKMPNWMWKCDTEECNDLFDAISSYKMGIGGKEEIKIVLDIYGISDYSKYTESIQKTLKELFPIKQNKMKSRYNKNIEEMDVELNLDTKDEEVSVTNKSEFNGISEVE